MEKNNQVLEFGKRQQPQQEEMPEEMSIAREVSRLAKEASSTEIKEQPIKEQPIKEQSVLEDSPIIQQKPFTQEVLPVSNAINKTSSADEIIAKLKEKQKFEEVLLPSRSMLYSSFGLEINKPVHVRPMTIEEEKILSTPRLIRSGEAIDKIYESCMYENIPASKLLSLDRIFLLFYIRGISYGPGYDVEIKCPSCDVSYSETVDLNTLEIEYCKDDFAGEVRILLPDSGLDVWYRLPRGEDERMLTKHREMKIKNFSGVIDDTLIRRNIMLITKINSISSKIDIERIVNNLSVKDSNYIRDQINNPGFGIQTNIFMNCPYCYHEWMLDLPIDANFFFPRTKKVS